MKLPPSVRTAWRQAWETFRNWQRDDGPLMAAAVAFYAVLSLFPLLMILTSALGFVLELSRSAQDAQQELIQIVSQNASPEIAERVQEVLKQVRQKAPLNGPVGLAVLLFAAMGLFANFERAFDRIWNIEDPKSHGLLGAVLGAIWQRWRAFVMLLCLGFAVVIVSVVDLVMSMASAFVTTMPAESWAWSPARALASLALSVGLFTIMYRLLPKVPVRWRQAAGGGLVAALLWEAARRLLSLALVHSQYNAYGVIGSLILVMLWIYTGAAVIFLGAEYVQILRHRRSI